MPRTTRQTQSLPPVAPGVSGRRQQFSASTRRDLVEIAREHFTEHGYAGTSLDTIVAGARVTKGALYHHFSGKQALFESVLESVEQDATNRITASLEVSTDPWDKAMDGLRAFLAVVQTPAYQRIVIQEGPAVLGHQRFHDQEERSTFGLVQEIVRAVLESSMHDLDEAMTQTFSRIFFGAVSAAGESVSTSEDQVRAVARIEAAIGFILDGLRALTDQGVTLADPADPAD